MITRSIGQNALGLSLFAVVTAGVIAVTQFYTQARIEQNEAAAKSKALHGIIPPSMIDNDLLQNVVTIIDPALVADEGEGEAYIARKDGEVVAIILPAIAPDGYSGKIKSIVGIRADGTLAGVRVLTHKETPGLGDKIEIKKSDWALQFDNRSLIDPQEKAWAVKKDGGDYDQLTGATITPRAVVKSVYRALQYYAQNQARLLGNTKPQQPDAEG